MVAVQSRLDDVLLAQKGKKVEATHQVTRTIPSICSEDGKSKRITIDVSPEGERELEKLDKKFKAALLEAGKNAYGKIGEVRIEARAAKPKKRPQDKSTPDGNAPESSASEEGTSHEVADSEEITEENTAPTHSGGNSFGG